MTQPKIACTCGKTHRAGTVCAKAERIAINRALAQEVADALSALPPHTIAVLDLRASSARRRTLGTVTEETARVTAWQLGGAAATSEAADGTLVAYGRDMGGYVPNSYGYAAESDELHWASHAGRTVVVLARVRAQSRTYGQGATTDRLLSADWAARVVTEGARHDAHAVLMSMGADNLTPALAVRRDELLEAGV